MSKDFSMRKLLADKVRLWMSRVPEADTQAKLAARAKMSQSSIHRVLFMDTEPELATAYKLANAFGITVSQLLADDAEDMTSGTLPFDAQRFAQLPSSEQEKIKTFAEFVLATYESAMQQAVALDTVSETIDATSDERTLVARVAQRNLTTDTLSEHETTEELRKKPTRKRAKSAGH